MCITSGSFRTLLTTAKDIQSGQYINVNNEFSRTTIRQTLAQSSAHVHPR
jgi:hypothetical protein